MYKPGQQGDEVKRCSASSGCLKGLWLLSWLFDIHSNTSEFLSAHRLALLVPSVSWAKGF